MTTPPDLNKISVDRIKALLAEIRTQTEATDLPRLAEIYEQLGEHGKAEIIRDTIRRIEKAQA